MDRYTLTLNGQQLRDLYDLEPTLQYKPRFNAAPAQLLPVLTIKSPSHFAFYYWGNTPQWANKKNLSLRQILVSYDHEKDKPLFQKQLSQSRCLVPADGFYQWRTLSKKRKVAYRGFLSDHKMFFMLGVWEEFEDEHGNTTDIFRIITKEHSPAEEYVYPLVILPEDIKTIQNTSKWEEGLKGCIAKQQELNWHFYPVSPAITDDSKDNPDLLKEVPPADQFGNYQLFS